MMINKIALFVTLAGLASMVCAAERFYVEFELTQDGVVINRGNDHVTKKQHTWSKGLKSSYLKLRCDRTDPQKPRKTYSTVDHFAGLRVTHQLTEDRIELTVARSVVQNRRVEIHDLPKNQCEDIAPILTTVTDTYSFPAKYGTNVSYKFGETMKFRIIVPAMGKALSN